MYSFRQSYSVWQKITFKFPSDDGKSFVEFESEIKFRIPNNYDSIDGKIKDYIEDWKNVPGENEFNRSALDECIKNPFFAFPVYEGWRQILSGEFLVKNSPT